MKENCYKIIIFSLCLVFLFSAVVTEIEAAPVQENQIRLYLNTILGIRKTKRGKK